MLMMGDNLARVNCPQTGYSKADGGESSQETKKESSKSL